MVDGKRAENTVTQGGMAPRLVKMSVLYPSAWEGWSVMGDVGMGCPVFLPTPTSSVTLENSQSL